MGSKGPRASERAFPMCRNITLGFPGKRDYGTAINRAPAAGVGAMMTMSGGGIASAADTIVVRKRFAFVSR